MTKQEQIEEMAVIGCVRNPQAHTAEECAKCDFKQGRCNAYRHAEALYEAGYRKTRGKDEALEEQIKHLNTIVERLDELLGEGIQDMWERSAVREFAEKLKARINADYVNGCLNNHKGYLTEYDINEELKEYKE